MFRTTLCIALAALFATASPLLAATYYVPGDYATLQEAIDVAVNDDTIAVSPGSYPDPVEISGKRVEILGEPGGADVTVGEIGLFLGGLILRNVVTPRLSGEYEGVLIVSESNVGLVDLVAGDPSVVVQLIESSIGRLLMTSLSGNQHVQIDGCSFQPGVDPSVLDVITAEITDCSFLGQFVLVYSTDASRVSECSFTNSWLSVSPNSGEMVIADNTFNGLGSLVVGLEVFGTTSDGSCLVNRNEISGYTVGISQSEGPSYAQIANNQIRDCDTGIQATGAHVFRNTVRDCDAIGISANMATWTISKNTVANCQTGIEATASEPPTSGAVIQNIVAGCITGIKWNSSMSIDPIDFRCNDLWDNALDWGGMPDQTGANGNISVDPLFCDALGGDYRIDENSICNDGTSCGVIGDGRVGCDVVGVEDVAVAVQPLASPNPMRSATAFTLPGTIGSNLQIFDVSGRLVRELATNDRSVAWDGLSTNGQRVSPGVYIYRVMVDGAWTARRLVVLK